MEVIPADLTQPEDRLWIESRAHCVLTRNARAIKVVDSHGTTRGAAAFDEWLPTSCQMHVAAETPMVWRKLTPAAFAYPFLQLGLRVLLAVIASDNTASLRLAQHGGFQEVYRVREGWRPGVDLVLMEIRREACRYIPQESRLRFRGHLKECARG